ncbi:MAG: hypothetical protein OQL27_08090 [Sedimenticola sp.]|nr:hypothetical protein [Sedimenticola sp.]
MIKKLLPILVLLVFSTSAFALGLGKISVSSALNEPLNARVGLISASATEIEDIRVKLASAAVFRRAGIERPFLLSKLRFSVVGPEQGQPYIQISTRESIREPYLDFLIEVSWAGGNLVREFTLLLDPPTYTPPKAQPVKAAPVRKVTKQTEVAPASQPDSGTYGPVRSSETLWVIAGKVQQDKGLSRNQTMVALLKTNPDAFQNGNINLLKKGAMLTVPSSEEISAIGKREALAEVRQQMSEWRQQRATPKASTAKKTPAESTPAAIEGDQPAAASVTTEQPSTPVQQDQSEVKNAPAESAQRLRVVDADRDWRLSDKSELGYPAQESDKLREAIKDSEQELAVVQDISQDIVELRAALESKVLALKTALDEKDAQLESLRKQIEQVGANQAATSPNQSGLSSSIMPVPAGAASQQGNLVTDNTISDSTPLESYWKESYWMILMGIIIVILASMLLFGRRKRENEGAFEAPDLFQLSSEQVLMGERGASEPDAMIDELLETPSEPRKKPAVPPKEVLADTTTLTESNADIASILTEADIYLAYRRYSQAETLVEEAMSQNPESPELKAKLLEIYAFRRDKKAFSRYLDQVYQVLMIQSPELWEKIVDMGHDLAPEHPAWAAEGQPFIPSSPPQQADDTPEEIDPLDIDMNLDIELDELDVPESAHDMSIFDELEEDAEPDSLGLPGIDVDFERLEDPTKDK